MRIVEDPFMVVQFRFPVSKSKRIRKKYTRDRKNWKPNPSSLIFGDTIICHPAIANMVRKEFAKVNYPSYNACPMSIWGGIL